MAYDLGTATTLVRESHSLLKLITHSELDGLVDGDGVIHIDSGTIREGLMVVCRMLERAGTALDIVSDKIKIESMKKQEGGA